MLIILFPLPVACCLLPIACFILNEKKCIFALYYLLKF